MGEYLMLTNGDREILDSYRDMLKGLSEYLGGGYEIILHSLEDLEHSAVLVLNGCHSGRTVGAPITDLALKMLSELQDRPDAGHKIYNNVSKKGVPMHSATFPVRGEGGRIIGLVCMNFYMDSPMTAFFEAMGFLSSRGQESNETFSENLVELLETSVAEAKERIYGDPEISVTRKNKEIVGILYEKGIFNVKDAVVKVAELLNISKNTVYMHLRNLEKGN